jgi:hypothetical protein
MYLLQNSVHLNRADNKDLEEIEIVVLLFDKTVNQGPIRFRA